MGLPKFKIAFSRFAWIALSSICLPFLNSVGCGRPVQNTESQLNWGVYTNLDQVKSSGLLNLAPQSRVCVTGYKAAEVIGAIKKWTDIIGRTPYLKVEYCFDQSAQRIIRLVGPEDSGCAQGIAGSTNTIDQINVCQHYDPGALNHVLLHETGHMWGLCDQYSGGNGCQGGPTNPNTIMGALIINQPLQQPTPDDIEGIKAVTSSPEIPANKAWLSLGIKPGTAPATPQAFGSTPLGSSPQVVLLPGTQPLAAQAAVVQTQYPTCINRQFCKGAWGWHRQGENGCQQGTPGWVSGPNGCSCRC